MRFMMASGSGGFEHFSMFGRTGAPTKRGHTRRAAIFCNSSNRPEIMGDTRVSNKSDNDDQKCRQFFKRKNNGDQLTDGDD